MKLSNFLGLASILIVGVSALAGCGPKGGDGAGTVDVMIDGSSTVYPIMERMAEDFMDTNKNVRITVGTSGTGGGFKKFIAGEIDIADASRAIEEKEIEALKANGIDFVEIPIAFDGVSVVINPQNDFAGTLTVAELKKIWEPGSKVQLWSEVREGFPAEKITLFGPGTDSGTFDYFTKAINGEEKASRSDYTASEDDNSLVQGVQGDKYAMGYFGYAYYEKNKESLKAVTIDNGKSKVGPSFESIADGTYQPLSRPLFLYVRAKALDRPEIVSFLKYVMGEGSKSLRDVGYVPLPDGAYELANKRIDAKTTGTVFHGAEVGVRIEDILQRVAH
ncbi:MAG: PstS family phosphate ABC transporter substrate-binding protein [Fimbriimonadaceae bacterium]|nr:PstS family phosphate ABC transporter substrate-binding protein [Fimbriimonadaceae bacterium]